MPRTVTEREVVVPVLGEIFREYGYEGTSLKLITERTSLGKGSLYHFFPGGKEEMATAVLDEISVWFEVNVYRALDNNDFAEAISVMFASVETYFRSGRRVCLVGVFALDNSRDRFPAAIRFYFHRWIAALEGCLKRRGISRSRASQVAREVVGGIQGAIVLTRALDDDKPFMEAIARLKRLCLGASVDR